VDIPRVVQNFRYFAGLILYHEEKSTNMEGLALNYTQSVPMGVVGLISPWNLPLYLLTWKVAPALAGELLSQNGIIGDARSDEPTNQHQTNFYSG
jgi:acyl-CoA reductase-like NAD-dependent aldehyde dehydrogenase